MIKIKDIISVLEQFAPSSYQEAYDNAGLITGDPEAEARGALICLDSIEAVVDEAIATGCNLVVAHHPIVFVGLKKINGKNYVERTIIKAIKNDIAIYAIHTNLDNVLDGVNMAIAQRLGLTNVRILSPKKQILKKLVTFCPADHLETVRTALFTAGAGSIGNYDRCSFYTPGTGTFRGNEQTHPFIGASGEETKTGEVRLELIFEAIAQKNVISVLLKSHPYEEVAYDIYSLENEYDKIGSGVYGELKEPMDEIDFLKQLKVSMKAEVIRHTTLMQKKIQKVAICGGSGSFLLNDAIRSGAQVFITADYKYHQFFDADGRIIIVDIGHFESEQYTIDLLKEIISKNFPTFAVRLTKVLTNPVHYM